MRNLRIAVALMLVITLGGCATFPPGGIGDVVRAVTTTINNPVGDTNLNQVKNGYAVALQLTIDYRKYCWQAPYVTLMADPVAGPVCKNRRAVVRAAQNAKARAKAAIVAAQNFIADNPTLNAATAIGAAMKAVTDYRNAISVAK